MVVFNSSFNLSTRITLGAALPASTRSVLPLKRGNRTSMACCCWAMYSSYVIKTVLKLFLAQILRKGTKKIPHIQIYAGFLEKLGMNT